jgi:hypothetical protein
MMLLAWVDFMVDTMSSTEESSMLWMMGVAPSAEIDSLCSALRMMLWEQAGDVAGDFAAAAEDEGCVGCHCGLK